MWKRGDEIEVGDVIDVSTIDYDHNPTGFMDVKGIKREILKTRLLIGVSRREVVGCDEQVKVVGHLSDLDTVEIADEDRETFWRLSEDERAEVMRVAKAGAARCDTFYVYPKGVGFSSSRVAWARSHEKGAIKFTRKDEDDTMTPAKAVSLFKKFARTDAEVTAHNVVSALGYLGYDDDMPYKGRIADYLDPLTFDDLGVLETFRFDGKSSDLRAKLNDTMHARVVHSERGKVIRLELPETKTAEPDAKVERVD